MSDETSALNWRACPHVSIVADRRCGAVTFKDSRLPVDHLFENLLHGATVSEFVEWYGADPEQVRAVLQWLIESLDAARDTSLDRRFAVPPQEAEQ